MKNKAARDTTMEARKRRLADAVRIGDKLQSEASRLAEWVTKQDDAPGVKVPYEVRMAMFEVQTAVYEWTKLRRTWSGLR